MWCGIHIVWIRIVHDYFGTKMCTVRGLTVPISLKKNATHLYTYYKLMYNIISEYTVVTEQKLALLGICSTNELGAVQ